MNKKTIKLFALVFIFFMFVISPTMAEEDIENTTPQTQKEEKIPDTDMQKEIKWKDGEALKILEDAQPLIMAFKKLAKDNLTNLWPHPFSVWFNYSHPPLLERIKFLEESNSEKT